MKHLDVILIVIGAAVCLLLLIPAKNRRIGPYWLTYVIPSVVGAAILAAVITNAIQSSPPSQRQMWNRMEKQGYTPTDITQQEKADSGYIRDRIHKVYVSESDITVTWYQFSFESDGRQQISNLLEALEAADSSYRGESYFGRHTVRWIITNGSDYRLMIVYDDTLLSITGTAQQAARIKDLAQALGYWE